MCIGERRQSAAAWQRGVCGGAAGALAWRRKAANQRERNQAGEIIKKKKASETISCGNQRQRRRCGEIEGGGGEGEKALKMTAIINGGVSRRRRCSLRGIARISSRIAPRWRASKRASAARVAHICWRKA
jgi:hypothetical protein